MPPTPGGWEHEPRDELLADLAGAADLARAVLTLTWLAEAVDHDPASVPTHLSWVTRAFGGGPPSPEQAGPRICPHSGEA